MSVGTRNTGLTLQQAIEEAHRCLLCHDAPCSAGCPGGTDPAKFIRQIRFYNFKGAARTVIGNNPLGGVCAYICPTEETCVRACTRTALDRPIDIDGLQRFAVEYGRAQGMRVLKPGEPKQERVAVIGAGPAGLAAAARLAQIGYRVTVFEGREKVGGMLRYGVPPSRLSEAALDADLDEISALGVDLRTEALVSTDNGAANLLDDGYAAVFVAPGLWSAHSLDLPGSDLEGVTTALDFLDDVHTAPDQAAALVRGKNVAIIGGGSVAMDVARCAREMGAGRIYAIALESMTELPAQSDELTQALADGVAIKPQCRVTAILGEEGKVVGLKGVETEWIEPDKLVPENARDLEGTSFRLNVGAVVQAIGQGPTKVVSQIVTHASKRGYLLQVDERTQATSKARVYAGGDITRGPSTVVAAVGDGKRAADAIHELLANEKGVAQ